MKVGEERVAVLGWGEEGGVYGEHGLCERRRVGERLESCVEKASVPQVAEPSCARSGPTCDL